MSQTLQHAFQQPFQASSMSSEESNTPSIDEHLDYIEHRHPKTFELFSREVVLRDRDKLSAHFASLCKTRGHSEFNENDRGKAYRERQKRFPLAREYGDRKIFSLFQRGDSVLSFQSVVADLIGGSATSARVASRLLPRRLSPYIIACDPCADMVEDALTQNYPAVWQAAQDTLFGSNTLDFVLGSRGFHHIDPIDRPAVFAEAFRVLKPGGRIIVLDFEEDSPTAKWYSEGLDQYTATGHKFVHFTRSSFRELLDDAGFEHIEVCDIYDPFVFRGPTAEDVHATLLDHVVSMFGMVNLARRPDEAESDYWSRIDETLAPFAAFSTSDIAFDDAAVPRFVVFQETGGTWRAEFPRVALCATAVKPARFRKSH